MTSLEIKQELSELFNDCFGDGFGSTKKVRTNILIDAIASKYASDNEEIKLELKDFFDPTYSDVTYIKDDFISKFTEWMLFNKSESASKLNYSICSAADKSFDTMPASTPNLSKKWQHLSFHNSPCTPIGQPEFIADDFLPSPEKCKDNSSLDNSFIKSLKTSYFDVKSQLSQTRERADSYELKYVSLLDSHRELKEENCRLLEALAEKTKQESELDIPEETSIENELANCKIKLAQSNTKCNNLNETVHFLRQEIGKLKVQLRIASDTERELKHRINELERELKQSDHRRLSLEFHLQSEQTRLANVTSELNAAQLKINCQEAERGLVLLQNVTQSEDQKKLLSLYDEISAIEPEGSECPLVSPMRKVDGYKSVSTSTSFRVQSWKIQWLFLSVFVALVSVIWPFNKWL